MDKKQLEYYVGATLDEKRAILGDTFAGYENLVHGNHATASRHFKIARSLWGMYELNPLTIALKLIDGREFGRAKELIENTIDELIKNTGTSK